MEKAIKIRTSGGKYIYGTLRGSLKKPLVVFVHGLTGHMNEHIHFNGARYIEKHGFSSFRFNLYDYRKDARKLVDCTLKIHASDLDRVIAHFRRKGGKRIGVVGHSYGGPTILFSKKKNFDAVVLWDPTTDIRKRVLWKGTRRLKSGDSLLEWGTTSLIGYSMVEEAKTVHFDEFVRDIHAPIKIICAEKAIQVRRADTLYNLANKPRAFVIIKNADHTFDIEGTEEKLFRETVRWFKKYL